VEFISVTHRALTNKDNGIMIRVGIEPCASIAAESPVAAVSELFLSKAGGVFLSTLF
jgi:hypothetical protein